ncbi:MAG: TrbC/VirB2 family protein [Gammaproteobacteria bacterium]
MFHRFNRAPMARQSLLIIGTAAALTFLPQLACAQASPFQTGADSLVTNLIALATPIAILAIMALAVVAMTGRISWGWPIGALIGVGVIFGAPQIVTWARGLFGV